MQELHQTSSPTEPSHNPPAQNLIKWVLGLILIIGIAILIWLGITQRGSTFSPKFFSSSESPPEASAEPFVPNQFADSNTGIPVPVGTCGRGMQIEFTQGALLRLLGKNKPAEVEVCELEVDVSTPYGKQTYACNFVTAAAETIYLQSDYLGFDRDFLAQHCIIKESL